MSILEQTCEMDSERLAFSSQGTILMFAGAGKAAERRVGLHYIYDQERGRRLVLATRAGSTRLQTTSEGAGRHSWLRKLAAPLPGLLAAPRHRCRREAWRF